MQPIRIACAVLAVALCMPAVAAGAGDAARPNFLVITLEDLSAFRLGCYGDQLAHTPAIDNLLTGKRPYATLNALNLIDLLPKPFAGRLRAEIEALTGLKSRSSADAERYVRDLSRTMLKSLP